MQTRCIFTEDSCESGVILWCGLVGGCLMFQVDVLQPTEPDCRALVCSHWEQCRLNLRCFERHGLIWLQLWSWIGCNSVRSVAHRWIFCWSCLHLFPLIVIVGLAFSSASDSSAAFSASCSLILSAKIFSSASAAVYPLVSAISVRNGRRRTAFLDVQSRRFFDFASSPAAARTRTSVVWRRIVSPLPAKMSSISIETMVVVLRDTTRAKVVTVFPRDLLQTDACTYVAWIYLGVVLLVSTSRFNKSVLTRLHFEQYGLSECMASWIENIFVRVGGCRWIEC